MKKKVKIDIENFDASGSKEPGFKVPENYFEEFSDALFTKIHEESLPKETGFTIPKSYFEEVGENIISAIEFPKKRKNTKVKILYAISSVAAAVLLFFSIFNYNKTEVINFNEVTNTDIEEWITQGNMNFDSYDVASIDSNISWSTTIELENISNEEIDNYLHTVDAEFLFNEN